MKIHPFNKVYLIKVSFLAMNRSNRTVEILNYICAPGKYSQQIDAHKILTTREQQTDHRAFSQGPKPKRPYLSIGRYTEDTQLQLRLNVMHIHGSKEIWLLSNALIQTFHQVFCSITPTRFCSRL